VLLERRGRLVTAVGRASRASRATSGSPALRDLRATSDSPDRRGPSVSRASRAVAARPETRVARDPTETSDHQVGTFARATCCVPIVYPRSQNKASTFLFLVICYSNFRFLIPCQKLTEFCNYWYAKSCENST